MIIKILDFGEHFKCMIDQVYSENSTTALVNDGKTEQIYPDCNTREGTPFPHYCLL